MVKANYLPVIPSKKLVLYLYMEKERISEHRFAELVHLWLQHAENVLFDEYYKNWTSRIDFQAMKAQGLASDVSIQTGLDTITPLIKKEIANEQAEILGQNIERLKTLAKLSVGGIKSLKGKTVVSIGGGPGDKLCEPWFPRMAGIVGARAINFDVSAQHSIDAPLGVYTHIGGDRGNVFNLLINDETLDTELAAYTDIMIIECNNLIGKNPSPDLAISLGQLGDLDNNPILIQLRKNLFNAAKQLLAENGVLAIDDFYWIKKDGELQAVDQEGNERNEKVFEEEV